MQGDFTSVCLIDLISGKTPTFRNRHRYSPDTAWESPSTQLPLLLLGVMEGGRMWREEVSFLQADCWMERLRDGQMTMAGRPGPECRLRETYTLLRVGSGRYAKCTELRPSQRIWQGDPFTDPPPSISCQPPPSSLLPASPLSLLPPFVDTQPGGDELTQRVKTGLGALSPPLPLLHLFFLWWSNYVCRFFRQQHKWKSNFDFFLFFSSFLSCFCVCIVVTYVCVCRSVYIL